MTRRIILAVIVGWVSSVVPAILAQTSVSSMLPVHEKLAVFLGKWAAEADFKPSKTSSGGKSNWTEVCQWLEGNALLCHSEGEFGGHPVKEVSVMASVLLVNVPNQVIIAPAATAASRTRLWLASGWGCRGQRLPKG